MEYVFKRATKIMVKTSKVKEDISGRSGGDSENEELLTPKQKELIKQADDVEELLLKHFSVERIAILLDLSIRTIERRIAERRAENLKRFVAWTQQKRAEKAAEFEAEYKMIKVKLWSIHASAKSDKDKTAAIYGVMEAIKHEIRIKQILGYMPKDNEDAIVSGPVTIVWGSMKRPDRTKQLAEKAANEKHLQNQLKN